LPEINLLKIEDLLSVGLFCKILLIFLAFLLKSLRGIWSSLG